MTQHTVDILWQVFCDDGAGNPANGPRSPVISDGVAPPADPNGIIQTMLQPPVAVDIAEAGIAYRTTDFNATMTELVTVVHNALFDEQRQGNPLHPRRWWWNNLRRSQGQRRFCWSSGGLSLPVQ